MARRSTVTLSRTIGTDPTASIPTARSAIALISPPGTRTTRSGLKQGTSAPWPRLLPGGSLIQRSTKNSLDGGHCYEGTGSRRSSTGRNWKSKGATARSATALRRWSGMGSLPLTTTTRVAMEGAPAGLVFDSCSALAITRCWVWRRTSHQCFEPQQSFSKPGTANDCATDLRCWSVRRRSERGMARLRPCSSFPRVPRLQPFLCFSCNRAASERPGRRDGPEARHRVPGSDLRMNYLLFEQSAPTPPVAGDTV